MQLWLCGLILLLSCLSRRYICSFPLLCFRNFRLIILLRHYVTLAFNIIISSSLHNTCSAIQMQLFKRGLTFRALCIYRKSWKSTTPQFLLHKGRLESYLLEINAELTVKLCWKSSKFPLKTLDLTVNLSSNLKEIRALLLLIFAES